MSMIANIAHNFTCSSLSIPSWFWLMRRNATKKSLCSSVVSIFSVSSAGSYLLYSLTYFPGVFKVNLLRLPTFTSNKKLSGEWTTCTRVETLSGDRLARQTANTFIFIFYYIREKEKHPIFYYLFWHFDYGGKKNGASSMSYIYGLISILQAYRREEAECVMPGKAVKACNWLTETPLVRVCGNFVQDIKIKTESNLHLERGFYFWLDSLTAGWYDAYTLNTATWFCLCCRDKLRFYAKVAFCYIAEVHLSLCFSETVRAAIFTDSSIIV